MNFFNFSLFDFSTEGLAVEVEANRPGNNDQRKAKHHHHSTCISLVSLLVVVLSAGYLALELNKVQSGEITKFEATSRHLTESQQKS